MIDSWDAGVQIATHGSGSLARTVPFSKNVRKRAGMLSRFFASSECSKWPRNDKVHVPAEKSDRSGGVGGAPPLRSIAGRHPSPLSPTLQHPPPLFRPTWTNVVGSPPVLRLPERRTRWDGAMAQRP